MSDSGVLFPKNEQRVEEGLVVTAPKSVVLTPAEQIVSKEEKQQSLTPAIDSKPEQKPIVQAEIRYNVYQTQKGDYYAAENPKDIGDCMKPSPSPALYKALTSRVGDLAHRDAVIDTINQEGNGVIGAQRSGVCMLIGA